MKNTTTLGNISNSSIVFMFCNLSTSQLKEAMYKNNGCVYKYKDGSTVGVYSDNEIVSILSNEEIKNINLTS